MPRDGWRGARPGAADASCPDQGPQNTRDQLRGAHDLALVHHDPADQDASTRIQPPLVSCIALFGRQTAGAPLCWPGP